MTFAALSTAALAANRHSVSVRLTGEPAIPTTATSAQFTWSTSGGVTSTTCSFDGSLYVSCSSGVTYNNLTATGHQFSVRVTNNQSSSVAYDDWTISAPPAATPVSVTLTGEPAIPTAATSAQFTWSTSGGVTSTTCSFDGSLYVSCSSGVTYNNLTAAGHQFSVVVAHNQSSSVAYDDWTISAPPAATPVPVTPTDGSVLSTGISIPANTEPWFYDLSASAQATQIDNMVADNVGWLRLDLYANLQDTPDPLVEQAAAAGINIDGIIEPWGVTLTGTASTDAPIFAAACTAVVNKYKAMGVHTYEVINEPNNPGVYTAAYYTALLNACYPAVKAADPTATVLLGGLSIGGAAPDGYAATYLAAIYAAGGGGHFDAANLHPYDFVSGMSQSPQSAASCPGNQWNAWVVCPYSANSSQQNEIYAMRQVMNANGDNGKAIWLTEFGCPTGTDGGYTAVCSDTSLAAQITAAYTRARANPSNQYGLLGPLFMYNWEDNANWDDFGLYQSNGTAKTNSLAAFVAAG